MEALNAEFASGKLMDVKLYSATLLALGKEIDTASKEAAEATPEFKAVADAREKIKQATEAALSPTQRLAVEQERLNKLVGQNGFTSEEAAKALAAYRKEMAGVEDQTRAWGVAQEAATDAIGGGIQTVEDLGQAALRVFQQIVEGWLQMAQTMKANSLDEYIAAGAQYLFGGGRAPAMPGYSPVPYTPTPGVPSLPATMPSPVFHMGTSSIGSHVGSRRVPSALIANAPRFHTGLAPDERLGIFETGERVFSRMDNARLVRAVEGGGGGALNVQIINNAGADVQAQEKRGPGGERQLMVIIDKRIKQQAEGRYGLTPTLRGV